MAYVIDTNIFNQLVDGKITPKNLPVDAPYIATHIQIDEINNTKNSERRAQFFLMFAKIQAQIVPTESFIFDISRWDEGKWSDGQLFGKMKQELDFLNKSKSNNARDVLISEVAIINGFTLITADSDLATVTLNNGGKVIKFSP